MQRLLFGFFSKLFKWALYLALTGELVSCTMYMKERAFESVSGGLISLQSINQSLHKTR